MRVVVLMPAYNEAGTIANAIESLLAQTVPVEIVVLPNGCTDNTADIARTYPVIVREFGKLSHKKSEAMNRGWQEFARSADLVITIDADTTLNPDSVELWVREFEGDAKLAGSCARFTFDPSNKDLLTRLQRLDFSMGIDISLRRGWSSVLAGAASCFRGSVLNELYALDNREGPWSYESSVEDFEVTYQALRMGYSCHVSPTVRAYTDAMKTWRALRGQRMKWNMGTIEDLLRFGVNKTTFPLWRSQLWGWFGVLLLLSFVTLLAYTIKEGQWQFTPMSIAISVVIPGLVWLKNIKHAFRVPHYDWVDIAIAACFVTYEVFSWIRMVWFVSAWLLVVKEKVTKNRKDRWQLQYSAEVG